ncbi:MAG TPA: hypothetical protein PKE45_05850, partial [Caldilineaceae bacterium]|nr:hypothetical protein [Caldilineaceae bacterium]
MIDEPKSDHASQEPDGVKIGDIQGDISKSVITGGNIDNVHIGDTTEISHVEEAAVASGERAAAATGGAIALNGNVGGGLNISIGSKDFHLARWMQITIAVITISILFLVGTQAFTLYTASQPTPTPLPPTPTPIPPMTGDFNVAVAQFEVTGDGPGLDAAQNLALGFANSVDQVIDELIDNLGVIQILPPQVTGLITGTSINERTEQASTLAQALHADVVIYGTVAVDGDQASIQPEFYLNSSRNDGLIEADEITGQYKMGLQFLWR